MGTYDRGTVVRVSTSAPFATRDDGPVDPSIVSLLVACKGKLKAQYDYPSAPLVRDGVGLYHADLVTTPGGPPGYGSGAWTYLWAGKGVGFAPGTMTVVEPVLVPIWLQNPVPPPVVDTRTTSDIAYARDSATAAGPPVGAASDQAFAMDLASVNENIAVRTVTDTALASDSTSPIAYVQDVALASDSARGGVRLHPVVNDTAHASDVASNGGQNMAITPNFQSGSGYTVQPSDAYGAIYMTSSGDNVVTLNANVLSVGQWFLVVQYGAGVTQITNGAGMTITSVSSTQTVLFQYGEVKLHIDQANNANLTGNLGA